MRWTADGKVLLVGRPGTPTQVFGIEFPSGTRKLFKTLNRGRPYRTYRQLSPRFLPRPLELRLLLHADNIQSVYRGGVKRNSAG